MSQASLEALRNLLAASDEFQTIVGAATALQAKEQIAIYSAEPPMTAPCATVFDIDNQRQNLSPDAFYYSGTMGLLLELPRPEATEYDTEYDLAKETWETIKQEMQNLANVPGGLSIAEIRDADAEDAELTKELQRWFFNAEIDWPGGV